MAQRFNTPVNSPTRHFAAQTARFAYSNIDDSNGNVAEIFAATVNGPTVHFAHGTRAFAARATIG
jgi:hypothetical protein